MHELLVGASLFLLLNVLVGLYRVARGPSFADRMLVAQLFGTTGVAALLLLGEEPGQEALRDVALVFALLAAVTAAAFVRLSGRQEDPPR